MAESAALFQPNESASPGKHEESFHQDADPGNVLLPFPRIDSILIETSSANRWWA